MNEYARDNKDQDYLINFMLDQPMKSRSMICNRHRKQKITHLCVDLKCQNNPSICEKCVSEGFKKSYHYNHQQSIKSIEQSMTIISTKIREHINPVNKIFKSTLGRNEYNKILENLEQGQLLQQKISQRIVNLKNQIEGELDLLLKQFQKVLIVEKQQYFKLLDTYQKIYAKNYDYVKSQTQSILEFQQSINLHIKICAQTNKKTNWVIQLKKSLNETGKKMETSGYITQVNKMLLTAQKKQIDLIPSWRGGTENNSEIQDFIRKFMNNWISLPEIKLIEEQLNPKTLTNIGSQNNSGGSSFRNYGSITKNNSSNGIKN